MKCPIDNTDLQMTDRQGIEIDYCPQCRGVWLDRGELDKLIERSESQGSYPITPRPEQPRYEERRESHDYDHPAQRRERRDYDDDDHYHHNGGHNGHHKRHKKEGFLGDLFDF